MSNRRLRVKRKGDVPTDAVTAVYVERVVQEALKQAGVIDFCTWQDSITRNLQTIKVILSDARDAVGLAKTNEGSTRSQLQELLENLEKALSNIEELITPEDNIPDNSQMLALLRQARQQRTTDHIGEDVDEVDYDDPLDDIL